MARLTPKIIQCIHEVSLINDIFGNLPEGIDSSIPFEGETGWSDVESIHIPPFLRDLILGQLRSEPASKQDDLVTSHLLTLEGASLKLDMKNAFSVLREYFVRESEGSDMLKSSIHRANYAEIKKSQVLVGAPILHHNLVVQDHQYYNEIPAVFEGNDWSWVHDAGKWFRAEFSVSDDIKFTLPLGTSQGLTLKSMSDGPVWRTYSKGILAALAMKCKSRKDLDKVLDSLDNCFIEQGYDAISRHAFLGKRSQHSVKQEPSTVDCFYGSDGYPYLGSTKHLQGRVRAIFPFTEVLKVYYKRPAEAIKKALFLKSCICSTELNHIAMKISFMTGMSLKHQLFVDNEWACFYDLNEYDRRTHLGCYNIYIDFQRALFDDFDSKYGRPFEDAGIIFPADVMDTPDMMLNKTYQRSTLSGQPDVTVKNNVVHLLVLSQSLSDITDLDPLSWFKLLLKGGNYKDQPVVALMHGDDAGIYFSDNLEDYALLSDRLSAYGLANGRERGPIYLKKTVPFEVNSSIYESNADKFLDAINKNRSYLNNGDSSSFKDKTVGNNLLYSLFPNIKNGYNGKYLGSLQPIAGSLSRNRFGEYPTSHVALGLLGLSDTLLLLSDTNEIPYMSYWEAHLKNLEAAYLVKNNGKGDIIIPKSCDELKEDKYRLYLLSTIQDLIETKRINSHEVRSHLERLFYTSGEQINDDQLAEIYGNLTYDPDALADKAGLSNKSLDETIKIAVGFQKEILESGGIAPKVGDDIGKAIKDYVV